MVRILEAEGYDANSANSAATTTVSFDLKAQAYGSYVASFQLSVPFYDTSSPSGVSRCTMTAQSLPIQPGGAYQNGYFEFMQGLTTVFMGSFYPAGIGLMGAIRNEWLCQGKNVSRSRFPFFPESLGVSWQHY